eukprot:1354203-Prymnesium_polylepis.1
MLIAVGARGGVSCAGAPPAAMQCRRAGSVPGRHDNRKSISHTVLDLISSSHFIALTRSFYLSKKPPSPVSRLHTVHGRAVHREKKARFPGADSALGEAVSLPKSLSKPL